MKLKNLCAGVMAISACLPLQAALFIRDLDGNNSNGHEAVYDDVLNITWLADANLYASQDFGVSSIFSDGLIPRSIVDDWIVAANNFDTGSGYLGVNTWRLPSVSPVDGSVAFNLAQQYFDGGADLGYQISAPISAESNPFGKSAGSTASELAYHYYNNFQAIGERWGDGTTLSGITFGAGIGNANDPNNYKDLFSNIELLYWTGTIAPFDFALDNNYFTFDFSNGAQGAISVGGRDPRSFAWLVADGDVGNASAVPIPAAAWLFGSALFGLAGLRFKNCASS